MKLGSCSADAFGQVDIALNNADTPHVAPLTLRQKDRPGSGRAAAMLAFAAGLFVAALGARASDEPARPQPSAERAGTESSRAQPTAQQFAPPNQPDVSASDARDIDIIYRQLIGPPHGGTSSGSRASTSPSGRPQR